MPVHSRDGQIVKFLEIFSIKNILFVRAGLTSEIFSGQDQSLKNTQKLESRTPIVNKTTADSQLVGSGSTGGKNQEQKNFLKQQTNLFILTMSAQYMLIFMCLADSSACTLCMLDKQANKYCNLFTKSDKQKYYIEFVQTWK